MKKMLTALLAVICLLGLGCDPDQYVLWAPDGQKAAVIGTDGLHLCDPNGKLTELLVKDVRKVAWFSDSRRIVAARELKVSNWKEARKHLDDSRIARIEVEGERLFKELMAHTGPTDEWAEKVLKRPDGPDQGDFVGMLLYMGEKHAEELKKKVSEEEWKKFVEADGTSLMLVQMYELNGNQAKEGPILGSTFAGVSDLRPSPNGKTLAYMTEEGGEKSLCHLMVVPADGTAPPRRVADLCSRFVDWSPDGRYLVYARANPPRARGDDSLRLGTLRRMQVCEGDGTLKAEGIEDEVKRVKGADGQVTVTDSPAESLAGIIFNYLTTKVRCLRDGRIVFVSGEISLPVATDDIPTRLSLFVIDPARQVPVSRLLSRKVEGEVGEWMHHFEINPDQTLVAIPGDEGRMSVVSLSGGAVTHVQGQVPNDHQPRMVPSWRGSDELCYAVAYKKEEQKGRAAEIYLWRPGTEARCISKEWPAEVIAILERK